MAYFGTQLESGETAVGRHAVCDFFAGDDAPANVESASYLDRNGHYNLISAAYWTDPARYERWNVKSGFESWWNDPARSRDQVGHFREVLIVPKDRFETIFSHGSVVGIAKLGGSVIGPIREHNYWGSMRDRMGIAADNDLISSYGDSLPRLGSTTTMGRRLRLNVPENLAVIRSGQDWTDCVGAELATYDGSVRPALREGMHFLRDHPDETGCCEMRFAQQTDDDGSPLKKTFGLGYFLSLAHLERWAATHPSHLAIFSRFGKMVREFGADLKLKLWHEVSVLPATQQTFEYINCHAETGLLAYFPAQEW